MSFALEQSSCPFASVALGAPKHACLAAGHEGGPEGSRAELGSWSTEAIRVRTAFLCAPTVCRGWEQEQRQSGL